MNFEKIHQFLVAILKVTDKKNRMRIADLLVRGTDPDVTDPQHRCTLCVCISIRTYVGDSKTIHVSKSRPF